MNHIKKTTIFVLLFVLILSTFAMFTACDKSEPLDYVSNLKSYILRFYPEDANGGSKWCKIKTDTADEFSVYIADGSMYGYIDITRYPSVEERVRAYAAYVAWLEVGVGEHGRYFLCYDKYLVTTTDGWGKPSTLANTELKKWAYLCNLLGYLEII
ncbi:MAG: hypothetical protein IKB54_06320 [Clostridia bacterium]|nr:hypothetical protein [Clostridia bacterium]MBR2919593.1 hypothetical protein [Clostridia bacterium]